MPREDNKKCSQCGRYTEAGILTHGQYPQKWATGIRFNLFPVKPQVVTAYKCTSCGYIDLYADPE